MLTWLTCPSFLYLLCSFFLLDRVLKKHGVKNIAVYIGKIALRVSIPCLHWQFPGWQSSTFNDRHRDRQGTLHRPSCAPCAVFCHIVSRQFGQLLHSDWLRPIYDRCSTFPLPRQQLLPKLLRCTVKPCKQL